MLKAAANAGKMTRPAKPGRASRVAVCPNSLGGKAKQSGIAGTTEIIRRTLRHNRGFFTARILVESINKTSPIPITGRGISHPLRSLLELGEIRLVEKGNGSKPRTYLKL
jgi:hypothetical protein